jgi:hypothetical protein
VVAILPVAVVILPVAEATAAVVKGVEVPPLRHPRVTVEVAVEVTSLRHPRAEVAILPAVEAELTMLSVAAEAVKRAAALVEAVEAPPFQHPRATVEAAVILSAVEAMEAAVPLLRRPRATVEAVEVPPLQHP